MLDRHARDLTTRLFTPVARTLPVSYTHLRAHET